MTFLDTNFLKTNEIYLKLEKTTEACLEKNWVPAYYFTICNAKDNTEIGACDFRVGYNQNLFYGGHIGYMIYEEYRGNHYAGKACKLLFELAKRHEMEYIYITCNPDNYASRKTCEFAGGFLEKVMDLPIDNDMYLNGERQKHIYRFQL